MRKSTLAFMNQDKPSADGLYFVVPMQGPVGFRYFENGEFLKRFDTPWEATHQKQLGTRLTLKGWLATRKVPAPKKNADVQEAWRSDQPPQAGVYAVLSNTPQGRRASGFYRVWTGSQWGHAALSPVEAVLAHLGGTSAHMLARVTTWRPLTAREAAILASIRLPVEPHEITPDTVPSRRFKAGTVNDTILQVLHRYPGSFPYEIGAHLEEILGYEVFYAAMLHGLHKGGHVVREPAIGPKGPSFQYWALPPDLRSAAPVQDKNLRIQASGPATLSMELDGMTYALTAKEVCELRATLAGVR